MSTTLEINSFASAAHYVFTTRKPMKSITSAISPKELINNAISPPSEGRVNSESELTLGQTTVNLSRRTSAWNESTSHPQIPLHIIETLHKHHKKTTEKMQKETQTSVSTPNERASLVTKEMLNAIIDLDHDSDRRVVINILRKKPNLRSKEEIMFTEKALKHVSFFIQMQTELDEASYSNLFKSLRLEKFLPGQKIFSYGNIGRKFYILIQGSVHILLRKEGIIDKEDLDSEKQSNYVDRDERLKAILDSNLSEDEKKKEVEDYYPGFYVVRSLLQGESFGEIALQKNGERIRTATVLSREETLVGVLTYESYQSILAKLYERRYNDQITFFEKIDSFSHWNRNQISAFVFHLEEHKVARNKVIIKENQASPYVYFVKSGEIELRKNVDMPEDERSEILNTLETKEKFSKNHTQKAKKQEIIKLGKIMQGDYFGTTAFFEKKPSNITAIVSSADAVLLSLPFDKLFLLIKDRKTLGKMKQHLNRRDQWHEEMASNFFSVQKRYAKKYWDEVSNQSTTLDTKSSPMTRLKSQDSPSKSLVRPPSVSINNEQLNKAIQSAPKAPRRPQTSSLFLKFSSENISSPTPALNNNALKFAPKASSAYEKHQQRLKKLFQGKEEEEQQDRSSHIVLKTESDAPESYRKKTEQRSVERNHTHFILRASSPSFFTNNDNNLSNYCKTEEDYRRVASPAMHGLRISSISVKTPTKPNCDDLFNSPKALPPTPNKSSSICWPARPITTNKSSFFKSDVENTFSATLRNSFTPCLSGRSSNKKNTDLFIGEVERVKTENSDFAGKEDPAKGKVNVKRNSLCAPRPKPSFIKKKKVLSIVPNKL